jgi:hypothetical protein
MLHRRVRPLFGRIALLLIATGASMPTAPAAGASSGATTSYYERTADGATLFAQGAAAGRAGAQGIVILDFGRPAGGGAGPGTLDFAGSFIALSSIESGVESFVQGYYLAAPAHTTLAVAIGTNNSCGTGQPCQGIVCGCSAEPASFEAWGQSYAQSVERTASWARSYRSNHGYTDDVRVIAADDAEPGFDPGFANTYAVLKGYAETVGGADPPMVDYGSADANIWTESQLFEVAYGLAPNVPMPEIYYATQAADWARLLSYARFEYGRTVTIFGVLTQGLGTNSPQTARTELANATAVITGQQSFAWESTITH